MSTSRHRAMVVFVSAAIVISSACHRAASTTPRPSVVESSGEASRSTNDRGLPHFAGVDLVPTGSGFLVRIHSGLVGDAQPLYVIDGAPTSVSPTRGIDWFKPEDIADIKVLKQPHELAEYGPRGVNGVIVITTKQNPGRRR